MKKVTRIFLSVVLALLLVGIGSLQTISYEVAAYLAPAYEYPGDDALGGRPTPDEYGWKYPTYENALWHFQLRQESDRNGYESKHIEPIQRRIERQAEQVFAILLVGFSLVCFVRGVRWIGSNRVKIKLGISRAFTCFPFSLLSNLRGGKAAQVRRMNAAVREMELAKSLLNDGLISESRFLEQKEALKTKLQER